MAIVELGSRGRTKPHQPDTSRVFSFPGVLLTHIDPRHENLGLNDKKSPAEVAAHNSLEIHHNPQVFDSIVNVNCGCTQAGVTYLTGTLVFSDGGRLAQVISPAGYTEQSVVTFADRRTPTPEELANLTEKDKIDAFFAAELPPDTKIAYTTGFLSGFQTAALRKDGIPYGIQHHAPTVVTDIESVARTMPLAHITTGSLNYKAVEPHQIIDNDLHAEQAIVLPYVPKISSFVEGYIRGALYEQKIDPTGIEIYPRLGKPMGYGIRFGIPIEELTNPENIRLVQTIFDAEHEAQLNLSAVLQWPPHIENGGEIYNLNSQPSYIQVLHARGGEFESATTQMPYVRRGGFEHSDLYVRRHSSHPRLHSDKEKAVVGNAVAAKTLKTLDTMQLKYDRLRK